MNRSRHNLLSSIIILFVLLFGNKGMACSCGGFPNFCDDAVYFNKILVEIVDHQIGTYPGGFEEYFTQVKILLDLDNGGYPDTISLVNQNGVNCNGSVYGMTSGDTLIVSLPYPEISSWPEELENPPTYTTYDLFGCGLYFLTVNEGKLSDEDTEEVSLSAFLNDPFNNCPFVNSTEEADPFRRVQVGPNPVQNDLRLINFTEQKIDFRLYTVDGRPLRSLTLQTSQAGDVPMSDLPAGVYILRQQALLAEKSVLVVKY